jgi:hypothetical protein
LKVAVYAICKNEAKNVPRWYDSIQEADGVFVTDTGSSDNTVELLKERGVNVFHAEIEPWRFDVARNISLENVPDDYDVVLCIDLDEVIGKGWREKVEKIFQMYPQATLVRWPFVFSWFDEKCTKPKTSMYQWKIHVRHGYHWESPIHEVLAWHGEGKTLEVYCEDIHSWHYQDLSKPREYQKLIDKAISEDPKDQRLSWLRARELMMHNRFEEAIEEAKRHLGLTKEIEEGENRMVIEQLRALSMRYISQALMQRHKQDKTVDAGEVIEWMLKSVAECPWLRESWVALAQAWALFDQWEQVYACATFAQTIKARTNSIENDELAWGEYPEKLARIAWKQIRKGGRRFEQQAKDGRSKSRKV